MTTAAAIPQVDPEIVSRWKEAQAELDEANEKLQAEETKLASATAQFNEQCRLLATGKKAEPDRCRETMSKFEQQIIGLKSIVAEKQGAFDRVAAERGEAYRAQQSQIERQRIAGVRQTYENARKAVVDAQAALTRAQQEERRTGAAWKREGLRNPTVAATV